MSRKQRKRITLFLVVTTVYLYTFQICHSASVGEWDGGSNTKKAQEQAAATWEKIEHEKDVPQENWHLVELVNKSANVRKNNQRVLNGLRLETAAFSEQPLPHYIAPELDGNGSDFTLSSLSWTVGKIFTEQKAAAPVSKDGYQADSTDVHGVQGKVLGPSFDSSPHLSEWLAMKPLVQCDENVMTFTASGQILTHLLVDREGASPISLLHLPPYCGYSVKTSWSDLVMMVPYDACYITQENGSYVLPMLWWGSPLKLSCPIHMSTAPLFSLSAPSVFCSPYSMAVVIHGQEEDIILLGVIMNGAWSPFVSEQCAYRVHSRPDELIFYISYAAPCISISREGLHIQLIIHDREYTLSCPVTSQFPYIPDPVGPKSTFPPPTPPPPQPPTKEHVPQLPKYPYYPYLDYSQLPQVYPPGPQHVKPPQPIPGSPPGPQPQQQQQQSLYPMGTGKLPYFAAEPPKHPSSPVQSPVWVQATSAPNLSPVLDSLSHQVSKLPLGPSQYPSGMYYPNVPFYYPAMIPAPTPAAKKMTTTVPPATHPPRPPANPYYPQYYLQMPYYPAPAAAPVTQAPAPPPPSPPKEPVAQQAQVSPFYYPFYYYPYGPVSLHPTTPPATVAITKTMVPKQPVGPSYPSAPQKTVPPQAICPPHTHTICSHYPYPYYFPPYYQPPYPPVPQYPQIQPPIPTKSTTPTQSTPTQTTKQTPHVYCLMGRMAVVLPFAHPDSIQVRDQTNTWLFLSSVSALCGYMLQMAEGSGVILHSPLPTCHSQLRTPTTIFLPLRYWDLSITQYQTLDVQCPYGGIPAPVTPPVPPTPPTTTIPKPRVICSSHLMTVKLPSGSISGILLKDIKGNQMNILDAPEHCGYSASKGKDGKIYLSFQLHSHCHMIVQGKMYTITVIYMTINGRREAQFSCPVVKSESGKECNLPSEQHLPCGPMSVSQPQCLSMGCCFSKHPPACYYPMDECTTDRHFVFSVPASLTDPPLSPALLVAAGNSTCTPERVTSGYALFKIPMDGCGARRMMMGKTMIYVVEIINKVQTISLNYGTITRDSPVRLFVECRYQPGPVMTVSYLVKTPTIGPAVKTQGVLGVQLRIAKDSQYSSYYPQYHQPLQMLLGKPLYLEVRLLNAPDPSLVLLVHFCVAYPRSGKSVWVLLYNGCPNPLDPAPNQVVLSDPQPHSLPSQTRRFTIRTFQFLPDGEFKDPDEEIYFMCSTEICSPRDGPCVEGCFGQ